jgi:hypothetical protein
MRKIGKIDAPDLGTPERRARLSLDIPLADARRAVRSLASRADGILARRDRDPILRLLAEAEAAHCRRIAAAIEESLGGMK